jgi:PAS domain S-box-containing protein
MLEKLKLWADNCPENFANRYFLVSAEIARIEGRDIDAMRLYDQAIRSARDNNFVHHEALAAEVASRFYRARGFDRIADAYLRDAHADYARWGAQGKVRQLEQRYPQLREAAVPAPTGTFATGAQELDILAVARASQAISGEILLDNLLKTLMRIVLENAGARQGYLFLARKEELTLAAEACVENQNMVMQVHRAPGLPEPLFPASILNYVRRSGDRVLLNDATGPNPYAADEYFSRRHPRSVLCFPIVRQSSLIGLLYLENDLATHVFTPERLVILELLAAQAAIALENAELYADLKNNIAALRQSEQKFRAIFDQAFQFIGVLTTDGIVLQVNQSALQFAGISEDAVRGKPFWETPWWTHSAKLQQTLRAAIQEAAGGKLVRFEASHIPPDGQVRFIDFSLKPVIDVEGHVVQLISESRDITERKQAEDALRLSSERLQLATRVANIGIWDWDVANNELVWDDSMYQLYGIRKGDFGVAYDAWIGTLHPEDKEHTDGEIQAALRGEREYAPEFRILRTDGTIRHIKADSRTIRDKAGKPLRMIGTNIDVTERKQAEMKIRTLNQELEQRVAERTAQLEAANRELEAFAYSVSHDLRAPLRHIDGFLDLLRRNAAAALDEKSRHYMDTISGAAKQMETLIDDLLAFSRMGRQELANAEVDLGTLMQEVVRDFASEMKGRTIEWRIGALPMVTGDRAMLRVVLVNLISNALKFTQKRQRAEIEIGYLPGQDKEVVVFVRDNGAGFDMKYADKLFGVFQRLHGADEFEGTGIGLANVHRIIDRHGGRTWAQGKVDDGASFFFSLPLSRQNERHMAVGSMLSAPPR